MARSPLMAWRSVGACLLVVAVSALAFAEDVSVQAHVDRRRVPLNGRLQFSLDINGTQNVQPPDLTLDGFDAQYLGPSTQMSVINGQVSSSISHTYVLTPNKEGACVIGPIAVAIHGKTYQTQPIDVQVLPPASVVTQGGPPSGEEPEEEGAPSLGDHLQLQLSVDKTTAYLNQAIPMKLQLLVGGIAVRGIDMPTLQADSFLVKPFQKPAQSEVDVAGQPYTLLEFNTQAVPLKPGTLSLGPASMNCQVVQRRRSSHRSASPFGSDPFEDVFGHSMLDDFFGAARLVPVSVRAEPITMEILPLPEEGKPKEFAGAVGRFTLDVSAIPVETTVGEPITLTMTVKGNGNLEAVAAPSIVGDTSHLKVYEPKPRQDQTTQETQRTFEHVLIPTDASVAEIPAVRFAFFDPELGRYRTLTQGPLPILVKPAAAQERPAIVSAPQRAASQPAPPETLGRDIIYIKEALGALRPAGWVWYRSLWRLLLLIAPLILLGVSEGTHRYYERLTTDPGLARASGAFKRATVQCRRAKQLQQAGKVGECYAEIFRALQRYIGDRFNLPSEGLTKAELERHLRPRGIPDGLFQELAALCDQCDAARFAPMSIASGQMSAMVSGAESVLRRLEQWKAR